MEVFMLFLVKKFKGSGCAILSGLLLSFLASSSAVAEASKCEAAYTAVYSQQQGAICVARTAASNVTQADCVYYHIGGSSESRLEAACSDLGIRYKSYKCVTPYVLVKNTSQGEICGLYVDAEKKRCQYYIPPDYIYKVVNCDSLNNESTANYHDSYKESDESNETDEKIIKEVLKEIVNAAIDES